jgi:hypothetical protein
MQPKDTVRLDLFAKNAFLDSGKDAAILEQQENNNKRHNFALLSQEERQNISSIANNKFYSRLIHDLKQRKGIQVNQVPAPEAGQIQQPQPSFGELFQQQKNQSMQLKSILFSN